MKNEFVYQGAPTPAPVRIEQVWGEKPGGGLLAETTFDVVETTAVGYDSSSNKYKAIKSAKVVTKYAESGTTLEVAKGSGIANNDYIGYGKMAVKVTAVNSGDASKDVLTISAMTGVNIEVGEHVFQAKAAADGSSATAEPIYQPVFIVSYGHPTAGNGIVAYANNGDTPVRLINGANVRKETCNFGADIEKLLGSVHRV